MTFYLHSREGKMGLGGQAPRKLLEPRHFDLRKTPFLIWRALQKGYFRSFVEKGRGTEPQDPPVVRLMYIIWKAYLFVYGSMMEKTLDNSESSDPNRCYTAEQTLSDCKNVKQTKYCKEFNCYATHKKFISLSFKTHSFLMQSLIFHVASSDFLSSFLKLYT